jgi:hypothetical protein
VRRRRVEEGGVGAAGIDRVVYGEGVRRVSGESFCKYHTWMDTDLASWTRIAANRYYPGAPAAVRDALAAGSTVY